MSLVKSFFTGIIFFLSLSAIAQMDSSYCERFRKGTFSYKEAPYNKTIIKRTAHKQIETDEHGRRLIYRIEWLNDCEYNLIFITSKKGRASQKPGDTINVKIIETSKYSYVYSATFNGKTYSHTIWFVK